MDEGDRERRRDDMDYQEHERTYKAFTTLTLYGVLTVAAVLILMAIFLL